MGWPSKVRLRTANARMGKTSTGSNPVPTAKSKESYMSDLKLCKCGGCIRFDKETCRWICDNCNNPRLAIGEK